MKEHSVKEYGFQELCDWINRLNGATADTYPPVYEDLYSLYTKIRETKAINAIEIGSGYSTAVMALALFQNQLEFGSKYTSTVKNKNAFKLISVDASAHFGKIALSRIPPEMISLVDIQIRQPYLSSFQDKVCTYFTDFPSFSADFIYLDGPDPDQVSIPGNSNLSLSDIPTEPMSGDLLRIESFMWPGTRLCVDGRGSNARFLLTNLSRNWKYNYDSGVDQHNFYLDELPWGAISAEHLAFRGRK